EGWGSPRLAESAHAALELLTSDRQGDKETRRQGDKETEHLDRADVTVSPPHLVTLSERSSFVPTIVATGHAHLDVAWLWPLWRTRQKVVHTVATALHL